jgi:hypothetical protein
LFGAPSWRRTWLNQLHCLEARPAVDIRKFWIGRWVRPQISRELENNGWLRLNTSHWEHNSCGTAATTPWSRNKCRRSAARGMPMIATVWDDTIFLKVFGFVRSQQANFSK